MIRSISKSVFVIPIGNSKLTIKFLHLLLAMLAVTIATLAATAVATKEAVTKELHETARWRLNIFNNYLMNKMNSFSTDTRILAENPFIIDFCKHPDKISQMNDYLLQVNSAVDAAVTYIMNGRGVVIGTSNWNSAESFLGKSLDFREYFKNAIKGEPDTYTAIGTIAKRPGYYVSYPVTFDNRYQCVLTIKYNLDIFEPAINDLGGILLVKDNNGVIFSTNDERYRFYTHRPLPVQTVESIRKNKQYGTLPLPPLPIIKEIIDGDITRVTLRQTTQSKSGQERHSDVHYIMEETGSTNKEWKVLLLVNLDKANHEVMKNLLFAFLTLSLFWLIGIFLIFKRESVLSMLKSEERFRNIFDGAPDAMIITDMDTKMIVDANPAASKLFQKPADELRRMNLLHIHPPSQADKSLETIQEEIAAARHGATTAPMEREIVRADGVTAWVEIMAQLITIDNKDYLLKSLRNISLRKEMEKNLAILSKAIETSQVGLTVTDAKGTILYINPADAAMHGYNADELLGCDVRKLAPENAWKPLTNEELMKLKRWVSGQLAPSSQTQKELS